MIQKCSMSFALALILIQLLVVPACAAAGETPFVNFTFDGENVGITVGDGSAVDSETAYTNLFTNYKAVAQAITGICVITSMILFLYQITKLGAAGDNQRGRKSAITGILVTGSVLAIFGGLEVVVSLFWNIM